MYKCDLPSGKSVAVEAPEYSHRMEAVKEFRSLKEEVGYTLEELMAAKSIAAYDGKNVSQGFAVSPIYLMSAWPNADVQYFVEWYMTLFFLDDNLRSKAVESAKKLMIDMQSQTSSKSKSSPAKL